MPVNVERQKYPASKMALCSTSCGKCSRIENPIMGGIHRRAIMGPLTFHFIDAYALNETART